MEAIVGKILYTDDVQNIEKEKTKYVKILRNHLKCSSLSKEDNINKILLTISQYVIKNNGYNDDIKKKINLILYSFYIKFDIIKDHIKREIYIRYFYKKELRKLTINLPEHIENNILYNL